MEAASVLNAIISASVPHMEESDARSTIDRYFNASRDMIERLGLDEPDNKVGDLKKFLNK